jgi:hypothetical protein
MKRLFLLFTSFCLLANSVFAQDAPAAQAPATPPAAEEPIVSEPLYNSSIEVGYRWLGRMHGNLDTYRSVVNLGEGPRLINFDFSASPSLKWIDDFELRVNNWGGDPYNTARFRALKRNAYRITGDYRNIQYFNALPSFANPGFEAGVLQSQRTFDTVRRYSDFEVELFPGKRFQPYFGYTHNSGSGRGISPYVLSFNEYPVSTNLIDQTDSFRGRRPN